MKDTNKGKLIFGGFFILFGLSIFLEQIFPAFNIDLFGLFFPILLIVWGFSMYSRNHGKSLFSIFLILLGGIMLLENFSPWNINVFWPLLIIFFGLSVIFGSKGTKNHYSSGDKQSRSTSNRIREIAVFHNLSRHFQSEDFKGGEVVVVFGSANINLSGITIKDTAVLEVNSVFGESKITVPDNIEVEVKGTGVIGNFDNQQKTDSEVTGKLIIVGAAVFGSVTIL